jgi:hypothetical protein
MSSDRPSSIWNREGRARSPLAALATLSVLAAMLVGLPPGAAEAALVLQANSVTASAGGSGSFDLMLIDTGGTFQVSGFSVELSVAPSSGIKFTGVTAGTTTATYIFGTLQAPPLSSALFPVTDFTASDSSMTAPGFVTLSTIGQMVGLEHVSFSVAAGTLAGPVALSIVGGSNTQILDLNANLLPFSATNGTVTVSSSAVPEPPSIVAWMIAMSSLSLALWRRKSPGPGSSPQPE